MDGQGGDLATFEPVDGPAEASTRRFEPAPAPRPRQRPAGITVIAFFYLLGGGVRLLFGLGGDDTLAQALVMGGLSLAVGTMLILGLKGGWYLLVIGNSLAVPWAFLVMVDAPVLGIAFLLVTAVVLFYASTLRVRASFDIGDARHELLTARRPDHVT